MSILKLARTSFCGIAAAVSLALASCGSQFPENRHALEAVSADSAISYQTVRFDRDFFALSPSKQAVATGLVGLHQKYGRFLDDYLANCMNMDPYDDPSTTNAIWQEEFCDPFKKQLIHCSDSAFASGFPQEEKDLGEAMTRFRHFFSNTGKPVPSRMVAIYSGLGQKVSVGSNNELVFSPEFYLGADFPLYNEVSGFYDYIRPNLCRERLPSEAVWFWCYRWFPLQNVSNIRLIDEMIYQGKLLYVTEACLPKQSPELFMGYSHDQWMWCINNEAQMWKKLKQIKHLYTNDALVISKYIEPTPFTSYFSQYSPGKAGSWLGWRIVTSYMANNPEVSLPDLMANEDAEAILAASRYNPTY